jgi:membrane protein DedA with SNARE-associated domain/rhodanese-related sulfurtransferase
MISSVSTLFLHYGYALLFVWVLLEQLGLPVPTVPLLLAAGTLSATNRMSGPTYLLIAVIACLIGDSVWFALGRRYGGKVLRLLCKISFEANTCVSKTENYFARRGAATLLFAKYVPGLGTVAPPIAGQSGLTFANFLLFDSGGSIIWAGSWLLAGRFFGDAVKRNQGMLSWLGHFALILIAVLLVGSFVYRVVKQKLFLRRVKEMRIGPQEVYDLIESTRITGEPLPFIIDLRSPLDYAPDPRVLPGAVRYGLRDLGKQADNIPHDRDIILYCNCPNEESAAKAALALHKIGIHRVRPLYGGFDGWKEAGFPLEDYAG